MAACWEVTPAFSGYHVVITGGRGQYVAHLRDHMETTVWSGDPDAMLAEITALTPGYYNAHLFRGEWLEALTEQLTRVGSPAHIVERRCLGVRLLRADGPDGEPHRRWPFDDPLRNVLERLPDGAGDAMIDAGLSLWEDAYERGRTDGIDQAQAWDDD